MLDDALSLFLSFSLSLSLSLSLTLYLSPYLTHSLTHSLSLPLSLSISLSLSEIYAQPPVDGYLSHLHYHTRWYSFSYFIIYMYVCLSVQRHMARKT